MKDYRLSELEFCDCHCHYHGEPNGCNRPEGECEAYRQYLELVELEKEIKSGDMIELPCKIEVKYAINYSNWQVVWRNRNGNDSLMAKMFETEPEADEFLAELVGDIRNGL